MDHMQQIELAFQKLCASLEALTEAIRPEKSSEVISAKVVRFPVERRALPRTQRVMPFKRWPSWGTEHVMTCTKRGCITCKRLSAVKVSV